VEVDLSSGAVPTRAELRGSGHGRCVIVATGARANWLGLPNEQRLAQTGGGVSACAVCDGALPAFRDRVLRWSEAATARWRRPYTSRSSPARSCIIHRRDTFRASPIMAERALQNPKIRVLWNTQVTDVIGDDFITGIRLENTVSGDVSELEVGGLFIAIGHTPNTDFLRGQLDLLETGYIHTPVAWRTATSVPGVYAAGDAMDSYYRQAVTAAGTGCMAALEAERWLAHEHIAPTGVPAVTGAVLDEA
jgi:thioredoxin reductase (NADPH)